MADIKLTMAFLRKCKKKAVKFHGCDTAIRTHKELWSFHVDKEEINYSVYCSYCGDFYSTYKEFNKDHGGE